MRVLSIAAVAMLMLGGSPGAQQVPGEPFPGYALECGYPIISAPTPNVSLAMVDASGKSLIVLDPRLETEVEQARRQFLIAHECAHHLMNHATAKSRVKRSSSHQVIRDQELSADCKAAEMLARKGQERTIRIMADRFYKAGLYSPGGGYPAGIQRSTIILHCAKSGRAARRKANERNDRFASALPKRF